jgi:hypothetical protein
MAWARPPAVVEWPEAGQATTHGKSVQEGGMPAVYYDSDGTMRYYIPPPPPPPPPPKTGTNAPNFQHAVSTAQTAGDDSASSGSKTELDAAEQDWGTVYAIIADQYQQAYASSNDPDAVKNAVDKLNQEYGSYFQDQGSATTVYNRVLRNAQQEVRSESKTPGLCSALHQEYVAGTKLQNDQQQNISTSSSTYQTDATTFVQDEVKVQLLEKFGDGNNGVYTATQVQQAADAVNSQNGASAGSAGAEFTDYVAYLTGIQSKSVKLTPAEHQIATADPYTLAFLMAAGVPIEGTDKNGNLSPVAPLSQPMLDLAKNNSSLFAYMELNGVNIAVKKSKTQYALGNGEYLSITGKNGKPFTISGFKINGQEVNPQDVVTAYNDQNATNPGQGAAVVVDMILSSPHVSITPSTIMSPTNQGLANLMGDADLMRGQHAGAQLKTLLANAPSPTSKNAAAYLANTINRFLTKQLNGFFDPTTFWNDTASLQLEPYVKAGLTAAFQNGKGKNIYDYMGGYLRQALPGASAQEAQMMINVVEGLFKGLNLNGSNGYPVEATTLIDGLSTAVQIVDNGNGTQDAANQVAGWLSSKVNARLLTGTGMNLYYDADLGNSDLGKALSDSTDTLGGARNLSNDDVELDGSISDDVQNGEQDYDDTIQKQVGVDNYHTFERIKASVLKDYFDQVSVGVTQHATQAALQADTSGKPADKRRLEVALWNEALAETGDTKNPQDLLDNPAALNAEWRRLQREYDGHLPHGVTAADLDAAWEADTHQAGSAAEGPGSVAGSPGSTSIPAPTLHKTPSVSKAKATIIHEAKDYSPTAPKVTVSNGQTRAVVAVARAAQRENSAIERDEAAAQSTQTALNGLSASMRQGVTAPKLRQLQVLERLLARQKAKIASDRQQADAGKAKQAAVNVVLYSQQLDADQQTAATGSRNASQTYGALIDVLPKGIELKQGDTLAAQQIGELNKRQIALYNAYTTAQAVANADQAKVNADTATIDQNYAQLQVYASDPKKYGDIAEQAVDAVNQALKPLGLAMPPTQAINPVTAQHNLTLANQAAQYFDALWNVGTTAVTALQTNNAVTAAQQQVQTLKAEIANYEKLHRVCLSGNAPLLQQLNQAESALAQAQGTADQANAELSVTSSYFNNLQGRLAVQQDHQTVAQAQSAYDQWRKAHPHLAKSHNPYGQALTQARQQLAEDQQEASALSSSFVAAYAQLYAQTETNAAAAQQGNLAEARRDAHAAQTAAGILSDDAEVQAANYDVKVADFKVTAAQSQVTADQQKVRAAQQAYVAWSISDPTLAAEMPNNPYTNALNQANNALRQAKQALAADRQQQRMAVASYDGAKSGAKWANWQQPSVAGQTTPDAEATIAKSQYQFFEDDGPQALAAGQIEQVAQEFGTGPHLWKGTQLNDMVGQALDLTPTNTQAEQQGRTSVNWYSGSALTTINSVTAEIRELGGPNAQVTVLPMVYAAADTGVMNTALFEVQHDGHTYYVDMQGARYTSISDYLHNNNLSTAGTLYLPTNGKFTYNSDGSLRLTSTAGHENTGWQSFLNFMSSTGWMIAGMSLDVVGTALDAVAAVAEVGSVGILTPIAGGLAVVGTGMDYLGTGMIISSFASSAVNSALALRARSQHGLSDSWDNPEARAEIINLAISTVGALGGVASLSGDLAKGAEYTALAKGLETASKVLNFTTATAMVVNTGDNVINLITNWKNMTGAEQRSAIEGLVDNALMLLAPALLNGAFESAGIKAINRANPDSLNLRSMDGLELRGSKPAWTGLGKKLSVTTETGDQVYISGDDARPLKFTWNSPKYWKKLGRATFWDGNNRLTTDDDGNLLLKNQKIGVTRDPAGRPPPVTYEVVDAKGRTIDDPPSNAFINPRVDNLVAVKVDAGQVKANGQPVYAVDSNGHYYPVSLKDGHPAVDGETIKLVYDAAATDPADQTKLSLRGQDISLTTSRPLNVPIVDENGASLQADGTALVDGATVVVDGTGRVTVDGRPVYTDRGDRVTVDPKAPDQVPVAAAGPIRYVRDNAGNDHLRVDDQAISLITPLEFPAIDQNDNPLLEPGRGFVYGHDILVDQNNRVITNGKPVFTDRGEAVTVDAGQQPVTPAGPIKYVRNTDDDSVRLTLNGEKISLTTKPASRPSMPLRFPQADGSDSLPWQVDGYRIVVDEHNKVIANSRPVFTDRGKEVTVDANQQPVTEAGPIKYVRNSRNNRIQFKVNGETVSLTNEPPAVLGKQWAPVRVTLDDGSGLDLTVKNQPVMYDINGAVTTSDGKDVMAGQYRLNYRNRALWGFIAGGKLKELEIDDETDRANIKFKVKSETQVNGETQVNSETLELTIRDDTKPIPKLSDYPNPDGRPSIPAFFRGMMRLRERTRFGGATKSVFDGLKIKNSDVKFLPDPEVKEAANIVSGLMDVLLNDHMHRVGYDHRPGYEPADEMTSVAKLIGEYSRLVWGSVGEFCGQAHYSDKNTSEVDRIDAPELDLRDLRSWRELYEKNPELAAKISMSLVGMDESKSGDVNAGYLFKRLKEFPGAIESVGEKAIEKEMVSVQTASENRIRLNSESVHEALNAEQETGIRAHYHIDAGLHDLDGKNKRPKPVQEAYENLPSIIRTFKQYKTLRALWAHAGSGRFVRASSELVDYAVTNADGEQEIRQMTLHAAVIRYVMDTLPNLHIDLAWNDVTENLTNNENLRRDFADILIAYKGRIHYGSDEVRAVNFGMSLEALMAGMPLFADVAMRDPEALYQFFRGAGAKLLDESQTSIQQWTEQEFKIDQAGEQESIRTKRDELVEKRVEYANLVDRLAAQERPALMKLVYEYYRKTKAWSYVELMDRRDNKLGPDKYGHGDGNIADLVALRQWAKDMPNKAAADAAIAAAEDDLNSRYPGLTDTAAETRKQLKKLQKEIDIKEQNFKDLRKQISDRVTLTEDAKTKIDDMNAMLADLRRRRAALDAGARARFDEWITEFMKQRDPDSLAQGTSAGPVSTDYQAEPPSPKKQTWVDRVRSLLGEATPYGKYGNRKYQLAAWLTAVPAMLAADGGAVEIGKQLGRGLSPYVSPLAFLARAALIGWKTVDGEAQRYEFEEGRENGNWTDRSLDVMANRMYKWKRSLGVSDEQIVEFAKVTEQFRANLAYLYGLPLEAFTTLASDPAEGVTVRDRLNQRFALIMAEGAKYQSRADRIGFQMSSVTPFDPALPLGKFYRLLTTLTYETNVASAANFFMYQHPLASPGSIIDAVFTGGFGMANLALMDTTILEGVSGLFKNNLLAMTKAARSVQARAFQMLLPDSLAWDANDVAGAVQNHALLSPVALALNTVFGLKARAIAENDLARGVRRGPVLGPRQTAAPYYALAGTLAAAEVLQILELALGSKLDALVTPATPFGTGLHFTAKVPPLIAPKILPNIQPTGPGTLVPPQPPVRPRTFTVESGNTLSEIAAANKNALLTVQQTGLSIGEQDRLALEHLEELNPAVAAAPNLINAGETLNLGYTDLSGDPLAWQAAGTPQARWRYVTVQPGEDLSSIAASRGLTLQQLLVLNPEDESTPNSVSAGDQVRVA